MPTRFSESPVLVVKADTLFLNPRLRLAGHQGLASFELVQFNPHPTTMNPLPTSPSESATSTQHADQTTNQTARVTPLEDDLDFGDVKLEQRQGAACSMEEGCESCQ